MAGVQFWVVCLDFVFGGIGYLTWLAAALIFDTEAALDDFRQRGWELSGQADAPKVTVVIVPA